MTMSEVMKSAHTQAREIAAAKRISYREALMYGLRRVYNDLLQARNAAIIAAQGPTPKFMWLRGW